MDSVAFYSSSSDTDDEFKCSNSISFGQLRDKSNIFILADTEFISFFRLSKAAVKLLVLVANYYWLLGDSGYSLVSWLIMPYRAANEGSRVDAFNTKHSRTRNIVERAIGLLKGRLRCVLEARELHYNPRKASVIINVCCTLHNICSHFKVPFEVDPDSIREQEVEFNFSNETENPGACEIQNNILNSIV